MRQFKRQSCVLGFECSVPRIRASAEVLELMPNGQVRVAAGPLKLVTSVDEVQHVEGGGKGAPAKSATGRKNRRRAAATPFDAAADPDVPIQTTDNTVDLRGLRAHEAEGMAEQHLDRCLGTGLRVAFLIHGHGTGALRDAIRDLLRRSPYVERFRAAEPRDGGEGVTVVWLR